MLSGTVSVITGWEAEKENAMKEGPCPYEVIFLTYFLPVFLSSILEDVYYDHFFCLSFAISKLLDKDIYACDLHKANVALKFFVRQLASLYGESECTFNSHLLLHLPDIVKEIGSLTDINSYIFEDSNRRIKLYVKGPTNIASQIVCKDQMGFQTKMFMITDKKISSPSLEFASPLDSFVKNIVWKFDETISEQFQIFKENKKKFTSMIYTKEKVTCNHFASISNGFFKIRAFIKNINGFWAIGYRTNHSKKLSRTIVDNETGSEMLLEHPYIFFVKFDNDLTIVKTTELEENCCFVQHEGNEFCIKTNNIRFAF